MENQTDASYYSQKTEAAEKERPVRPRSELPNTRRGTANNETDEICDDPCVICLESLSRGLRSTGVVLPCRHCYHEDCFAGWQVNFLENHTSDTDSLGCPVCRQHVDEFAPIAQTEPKTQTANEEDTEEDKFCTILRRDLWSSDVKVVEKALNELYYEFIKNDEVAHIIAINRMGGYVPLIRAMERHAESITVQRKSLCFLQYQVEYHAQAILLLSGSLEAVFAAMENHPDDMLTLACGCITLDRFISLSDDRQAVALRIKRQGGIQRAIYALRRFPKNAQLQASAYGLLASLCAEIEKPSATDFAKEGAIPIVIQAMKDHPAVAKLQRCACLLLSKLAYHKESRELIVDNGGLEAIRETREKHSDNDDVVRATKSALSRLQGL